MDWKTFQMKKYFIISVQLVFYFFSESLDVFKETLEKNTLCTSDVQSRTKTFTTSFSFLHSKIKNISLYSHFTFILLLSGNEYYVHNAMIWLMCRYTRYEYESRNIFPGLTINNDRRVKSFKIFYHRPLHQHEFKYEWMNVYCSKSCLNTQQCRKNHNNDKFNNKNKVDILMKMKSLKLFLLHTCQFS